jgi:SDR family mycofactocin-dependent oxidoreductase
LTEELAGRRGRVEGKVAIVTGAARGQGRSHAVRLASEGADIIAVDLCRSVGWTTYPGSSPAELEETVRLVEALGRRIVAAQVDVRDRQLLEGAVNQGVAELGRLDVVVANAGVGRINSWDTVTSEVWGDTIDINLTGAWHTVMATAPHLIAAGGGSIILVSSAAGLKAMPFMIPYVASKFGVTGLAKAFAQELAEYHVRVNSLHPTGVDTVMAGGESDAPDLIAAHPQLGPILVNLLPVALIQPEDVSNAVVFLASDESRYITASAMTVDAGITET